MQWLLLHFLTPNAEKWQALPGECFETAFWKKPVSPGAFWHFGQTSYGENNIVGQSRGRRDTLKCILTSISDVWDWLPSSWTTPLSPGLGEYCPPHHPPCCLPHSLGLACTSPFIPAFLDLSLLSDLALYPNVLICKSHQMKNGVLVHGLLLESSKSRSTELALKNAEWTLLFVDSWPIVAPFVLVLLFQERTPSSPMSEKGQDSAPPPDALDWNSFGKDFTPGLPSKWHLICQRCCTLSQRRTLG